MGVEPNLKICRKTIPRAQKELCWVFVRVCFVFSHSDRLTPDETADRANLVFLVGHSYFEADTNNGKKITCCLIRGLIFLIDSSTLDESFWKVSHWYQRCI